MRWSEPSGPSASLVSLGYDVSTWDRPQFLARGSTTSRERMPTAILEPSGPPIELVRGPQLRLARIEVPDVLTGRSLDGETFFSRRMFGDGLLVLQEGRVLLEWYGNGLRPTDVHLLQSVSKTLTSMMVGVAVADGMMSLDERVRTYVPSLVRDVWDEVTVQHVLDMSVGIHTEEDYADPDGQYRAYIDAAGYYGNPGDGVLAFVEHHLAEPVAPPGAVFRYASCLTNLLALSLETVYGRSAASLYEEFLFRRVGPESEGELNCDPNRVPLVEGHLNLTLRDFARWASLFVKEGRNLVGEQVVPASWIHESLTSTNATRAAFAKSPDVETFPHGDYHNQTWLIDTRHGHAGMLGIHGQFALFDPARSLLVVGLGSYPVAEDRLLWASMKQLWAAIHAAVG